MIAIPIITGQIVVERFGIWAGIAAGIAAFVASVLVVATFYTTTGRWVEREQRELSEKYPSIYRVTAVPTDVDRIVKAAGADIEIGDYGWEAEPIHTDGRIYLHGLTEEWCVVWHAGFTPDQIERIGPKPRSQYYLPYSWVCAGPDAPPCPFPVRMRTSRRNTLGYPVKIIGDFVQGKRVG